MAANSWNSGYRNITNVFEGIEKAKNGEEKIEREGIEGSVKQEGVLKRKGKEKDNVYPKIQVEIAQYFPDVRRYCPIFQLSSWKTWLKRNPDYLP